MEYQDMRTIRLNRGLPPMPPEMDRQSDMMRALEAKGYRAERHASMPGAVTVHDPVYSIRGKSLVLAGHQPVTLRDMSAVIRFLMDRG